ncbi:unnamed protein product [Adineta ricciae]|uniref:PLAT domain-containing protein n=1 Tax=Adineta ricciae TaxID=249248 RepID=A0A814RLG7_ADIRI|nr:unnamed protein product [Adineta ricciae]
MQFTTGISFNEPKFCVNSSWNPFGITFASNNTIFQFKPEHIFIDKTNTIYVTSGDLDSVFIWSQGDSNQTQVLSNNLDAPRSTFVTENRDIFVDNGRIRRINKYTFNSSLNPFIITVLGQCPLGIAFDGYGNLFIIERTASRVVATSPNGVWCVIRCSTSTGSGSNQLYYPSSLTFDNLGNLYVVDNGNNRVQKFFINANSCVELTTTSVFESTDQSTSSPRMSTSLFNSTKESRFSHSTAITFEPIKDNLTNFNCSIPRIKLTPNDTLLTTPIKFRRSDDFYLNSMIIFECNQSHPFTSQWRFFNCGLTCENEFHFNSSLIITRNELYIPKQVFPYGIYQLKLIINSSISSSIFIEIIPTNIIVHLIQYGTSMITISVEDDLILNPGKYSIDPDSVLFNSNDWIYEYSCQIDHNETLLINSSQSSLFIPRNSLISNKTYEFQVKLTHYNYPNLQAIGYLSIRTESHSIPMILISCLIPTMCFSNFEYQYINPTSQLSLFSICQGNCSSIHHITWKIYQQITNDTQWKFFSYNNEYQLNTSNLTIEKTIFSEYPNVSYWRFEFDENLITDYSIYVNDDSEKIMIGTSFLPIFEAYLPIGFNQTILVHIQDEFNAVTIVKLCSIQVIPDSNEINEFVDWSVRLLTSGNQNLITQMFISISQMINSINTSNSTEFITIREFLLPYITNLPITTTESIKLQSSALSQLIMITNQLTRTTSTLASTKCYELSIVLQSRADEISYEDVQIAADAILQCAANCFTAINEPLQELMTVLDLDFDRANALPDDYDTDLESIWSNPNFFADGDDFSVATIEKRRNVYYQQQTSILLPLAPYGSSSYEISTNLSTLLSCSLLDSNSLIITVNTSIEFHIERDLKRQIPSMIMQNVTSINSSLSLHFLNLTRRNNLSISFHFEMHPMDLTRSYLFLYKFDQILRLTDFDGSTIFCSSNLSSENFYTYFIDNQQISSYQSIVIGLRELNFTEMEHFCSNKSSLTINSLSPSTFSSNYEIRVYTSGCYYLDSENNWQSDGLIVGSLTNLNFTQCYSNYPATVATALHFLPLPIDWDYVFAHADFMKNPTIYMAIISVGIIYLILIIYARFQDNKHMSNFNIPVLLDNNNSNQYAYKITVQTGFRTGADTKSKVHFVLGGDNHTTNIRTFTNPYRQIFQRGGIDRFIITTPKSLGKLNYIHLWHDNTGFGSNASWFLKCIIVHDLQTNENFSFICQRWLAVEFDDGAIERLLPVANEIEKKNFENLLWNKMYENASDGHLWFSIFTRLNSTRFTRVQRCTCCFVLFFITMLFNILYYQQIDDLKTSNQNGFSLGPFYISFNQIIIGIIIELFSLFPSILLVQFFRRIRSKGDHRSYRQLMFPSWCLYIAFSLSFLFVGVSVLFILARGIELGDVKVKKWLTSTATGFFSSVCLTQPLQILGLTVFAMVFFSKNDHSAESLKVSNGKFVSTTDKSPPIRLQKHELINARHHRLKEIRFHSIINEFLSYGFFLCTIYLINYLNCNQNGFYEVNHLRKFFLRSSRTSYDYNQIKTVDECWSWLENSFVENLRAQKWYNDQPPRDLSGFLNDKTNRLIGWATMRQLRVKTELCAIHSKIKSVNLTCRNEYNFVNEERNSFLPGWKKNESTRNYSSSISNAFKYRLNSQLNTNVYEGEHETYNIGGYIYEFRGRLSEIRTNLSLLHQLNWIDHQTKAILIEISLYNPNIQMFISVNFLLEFLSTGGIFPTTRFQPLNIQTLTSLCDLLVIIIYTLFIIYFMIYQYQSMSRSKLLYFCQFWSWVNLGIIFCSWTAAGIYIRRYKEAKRIGEMFRESNGYVFVDLQLAVHLNDLFNFLLSFCCFLGTIKLIDILRFYERLSIFTRTLNHIRRELFLFMLMFLMIFFSFICLFYQLFHSKIWSCSSLLRTSAMLFEKSLLKFDVKNFYTSNEILGRISFTLFIVFVVFICMNMFISIIVDSFRLIQHQVNFISNENDEIFIYMKKKLSYWMGFRRREERVHKKLQYSNSIEYFPVVIDRLMDTITRISSDY